jgi:hypothetical protein
LVFTVRFDCGGGDVHVPFVEEYHPAWARKEFGTSVSSELRDDDKPSHDRRGGDQ